MGVAIQSKPLAEFFRKVLVSDMKLELDADAAVAASKAPAMPMPEMVELVPKLIPAKLFPSKTFNLTKKVKVTPILTPDNYMEVIPGLLATAKKTIYIENQYIRSSQSEIIKLLQAIQKAKQANPSLVVRIILGKLFGQDDYEKEKVNVANLKKTFGLVLKTNIRYINTSRFVHCHNKLIIVDGQKVLISSQNWSNTAVASNREAGVLMDFPEIAKYYSSIFESDWNTALTIIPNPGGAVVTPESMAKGNFVKVVPADYQEV